MTAPPTGKSGYLRFVPGMVILAVTGIIIGGIAMYRAQEREMRLACVNQLTAIAELKAGQIADWRAEQIIHARIISEGPLTAEAATLLLDRGDSVAGAKLLERFRQYQRYFGYREIILAGAAGRVCLRLTGGAAPLAPDMLAMLDTAAQARQPVMTDLHPGTSDGQPHIDAIAPLLLPGNRIAGYLVVFTDADSYLYPSIQSWPVPNRSAETLLVRRDGDDALFLNELRHQQGTALKMRIPLTRTEVPAVAAVLGREGVFEGIDYRGVRVLSVLKHIPGSPWSMVAKIDEAEALHEWHHMQGLIISVIIGLLAVVLSGGGLLWQNYRKAQYRALYLAESERARTAQELAAANQRLRANEQQLRASNQQLRANEQQLRAGNQQLQANEQQLRAGNQQLQASNQQLRATEQQLQAINQQLTATVSALRQSQDFLRRRELILNETERMAKVGGWEILLPANTLTWSNEVYRIHEVPDDFAPTVEKAIAFYTPESIPIISRAVERAIGAGEPFDVKLEIVTARGKRKWVRAIGSAERDGDKPQCVRGTFQDITENVVAQQELDRQHRLLDTLLANLTIGVFMVEAPSGRPLVANEAARRLLGRGVLPDATSHNLCDVYQAYRAGSGEPYPPADMPIVRGMHGESHHVDDLVVTRPDGSHTLLEIFGSPVRDRNGAVVASLVSFMDITERKRAERELRERNAELERFTYTVSHDLKSPLTTIMGFAGAIQHDFVEQRYDRVLGDLKRIEVAAERMTALINDLLELSRIGRIVRQRERVDFGALAQAALAMLVRAITERRAEIIVADGLPAVLVDRDRLVCVLQNLLENALKYMGDQPQPRVEIGMRGAGAERYFYVRDNGMGIDARHHERIFGLFDKLDPNSEGTGVGLALVRRIIEAHGGRVWLESAGAGQGCTFCFTLPDIPAPLP